MRHLRKSFWVSCIVWGVSLQTEHATNESYFQTSTRFRIAYETVWHLIQINLRLWRPSNVLKLRKTCQHFDWVHFFAKVTTKIFGLLQGSGIERKDFIKQRKNHTLNTFAFECATMGHRILIDLSDAQLEARTTERYFEWRGWQEAIAWPPEKIKFNISETFVNTSYFKITQKSQNTGYFYTNNSYTTSWSLKYRIHLKHNI